MKISEDDNLKPVLLLNLQNP